MSLQIYLAFVAACIALALIPGPNVTLVIATGLRYGTRAALISMAGTQVGLAIVLGIVALGLTTLMATMGYWFDWVRFAGAATSSGWASSWFVNRSKGLTRKPRRRAAASSCAAC